MSYERDRNRFRIQRWHRGTLYQDEVPGSMLDTALMLHEFIDDYVKALPETPAAKAVGALAVLTEHTPSRFRIKPLYEAWLAEQHTPQLTLF